MIDVPVAMQDRGPITGYVIASLKGQAAFDENTVVTFGTENYSCAKCGATDFPIGWIQSKTLINQTVSVHLFAPVWKAQVDAASAAISFGDDLECAAGGKAKKNVPNSGSTILGKAFDDAVAGGFILFIPIPCCPTAATS